MQRSRRSSPKAKPTSGRERAPRPAKLSPARALSGKEVRALDSLADSLEAVLSHDRKNAKALPDSFTEDTNEARRAIANAARLGLLHREDLLDDRWVRLAWQWVTHGQALGQRKWLRAGRSGLEQKIKGPISTRDVKLAAEIDDIWNDGRRKLSTLRDLQRVLTARRSISRMSRQAFYKLLGRLLEGGILPPSDSRAREALLGLVRQGLTVGQAWERIRDEWAWALPRAQVAWFEARLKHPPGGD